MGFISGLETYHLICTQLYRTLPELYLGMIKHKYLSTDMYTICTVYSIIRFTIGAILRNDKSSIFNNTINQYIDFILISTTKGVFFSYCINKLLTYISTLYDIYMYLFIYTTICNLQKVMFCYATFSLNRKTKSKDGSEPKEIISR